MESLCKTTAQCCDLCHEYGESDFEQFKIKSVIIFAVSFSAHFTNWLAELVTRQASSTKASVQDIFHFSLPFFKFNLSWAKK
jgi:hypothetical protein